MESNSFLRRTVVGSRHRSERRFEMVAPTEHEAEDWIRNALAKYTIKKSLGPDPRLFHDLKLRGVDAVDFLREIQLTFHTDLSAMRFLDYFPGEHYSPRDLVLDLFGFTDRRRKELRLKHLAKVCQKGSWFEPNT